MSRHFYDIGQILDSEYGQAALKNTALFESIIAHSRVLTPIKTTDYETLTLPSLTIIPPEGFLEKYKSDYKEMQSSMIHGEWFGFEELLVKIMEKLKEKTQ